MKKLKLLNWNYQIAILTILIIFSLSNCKDSIFDETLTQNPVPNEEFNTWKDLLYQFDLNANIVIVQKDGSIQEAIDAAKPDDAIYIEPGTYSEALKINKDNIKLIGLNGPANEEVILENPGGKEKCISTSNVKNVEIVNIIPKNFNDVGFKISPKCTRNPAKKCPLISMKRTELAGGIAHYQFELRLGDGQFDIIRIHRVIRETSAYHPIKTKGDIFMVHGGSQDFDDIYYTAGAIDINAKTSAPVYLAKKNIDVWGIDLAWSMVPAETNDFNFMKDWGIEKDIDHVLAGMSFARLVRCISSHNYDKMNLFGFSYSYILAYGAAGRETQLTKCLRNIKGIIATDFVIKYAPEDETFRALACKRAIAFKELLDAGKYYDDFGANLILLSNLATNAPDDESTIIPGFTNYQVMLFMATMTYQAGADYSASWHFLGGDLSKTYYTDFDRFLRLTQSISPYQPILQSYEGELCLCDEADVSFDDYLSKITVPILYIGAGGVMGSMGVYNNSLTSSSDLTNLIVSVNENSMIDYGHADLFLGYNADKLVWEPLKNWLISHN